MLLVGPLFLAGNSFDGRFVVLFREGVLLLGGVDLGLGLEVAISVDLEFVRDFQDCQFSQGDVIKLAPDCLRQSGDESADVEQLTFIGPASLKRVDQIFVGQIKVGFLGSLLDGVLVLLLFSQISDGLVITLKNVFV